MKDWETQLLALEQRLDEWDARYEAACARRLKEALGWRRWLRTPSPQQGQAIAHDARAEVGEREFEEASRFFEELYRHYLAADVRERGLVRARVGAAPRLFDLNWANAEGWAAHIREAGDLEPLRLALAAVSIDDLRVDVRQLRETLGRLTIAAARAGIDPAPVFGEVAALSNMGTAGGGAHLREFLAGFEDSPYFRQTVLPHLPARVPA